MVGRLLRDARILSGAGSQSQVALRLSEALGETVPHSRIGNYEQGARFPDPITMKCLSAIYQVPANLLYGLEESGVTPEEYRIIEAYRSTDDRGRATINQVAESQPQYPNDTPDNQPPSGGPRPLGKRTKTK